MFIAHTQGDQPELLEEDAVLLLDSGNRNQVLDFKSWSGPPRELSETASQRGGTLAGNQHGQSLDCEVPPGEGIHSAYQWDGEQLDHSPPTPKLPRYDSGIVIDTQLYVNFSKTGNKDDDYVQGIGQMCPVGMDSAGFKDSGRWDGMSYHVV